MKAILNEVSIPSEFDQLQLRSYVNSIFADFVELSRKKFGNKQLKLHLTSSFAEGNFGSSLFQIVYTACDWDDQALFSSLIDCENIDELINDHAADNDPYLKVSIVIGDQELNSLGAKAITYRASELTSLYSFNSHLNWRKIKLDLKAYRSATKFDRFWALNCSDLQSDANGSDFVFSLAHKYLDLQNWDPRNVPFPNCKIAEAEYRSPCQADIDKCKTSNDKSSVYRRYGKLFCGINGYAFHEIISNINSSPSKIRDIYSAGDGKRIRFISIDVENGGFELCDWDGTHLGSFGWNGAKIGDAKIATHSIKLSK
jgi:hypothetical protein